MPLTAGGHDLPHILPAWRICCFRWSFSFIRDFPDGVALRTVPGLSDDSTTVLDIRELFPRLSKGAFAFHPTMIVPETPFSRACGAPAGGPSPFPPAYSGRFVVCCHHPGTISGRRSRRMCSRIARNPDVHRDLGTATSAIWKNTYRECATTFAPILIGFSRSPDLHRDQRPVLHRLRQRQAAEDRLPQQSRPSCAAYSAGYANRAANSPPWSSVRVRRRVPDTAAVRRPR